MEDKHNIVSHSFLGNKHLLTSIDYEVASLIIDALFGIVGNLLVIQVLQVTEVRSDHNWHSAHQHSLYILHLKLLSHLLLLLLTALLKANLVKALQLQLPHLYIDIDFGGVSETSNPCLMWEYGLVLLISLQYPRGIVHVHLLELYLIDLVISLVPAC